MEIPYTVQTRPETGVYNAKLGIWLFLASEVMLFGGLFSAYVFLRIGLPEWPGMIAGHHYTRAADLLNVPLATVNTLILIASSVTMVMSWASLVRKQFGRYRWYMGGTIALGLAFLALKGIEYNEKFAHGLYPEESLVLAIYFVMTGLHALHVLGGVLVNAYFWGPGAKLWETDPEWFTNRIEIAGLYWHFVDLVWIFLFPTLYLL